MFNSIIAKAMNEASRLHRGVNRKGTDIPYIVHPFEVALILKENGMTDEVIAAGLLHDVLEDSNINEKKLRDKFKDSIVDLVVGASEQLKGREDRPWKDRKEHTVDYLKDKASFSIKCVACADKLSNIRSIARDLIDCREEDKFWSRFNANKQDQKWYYEALVGSLSDLEGLMMYRQFRVIVNSVFNGNGIKVDGNSI